MKLDRVALAAASWVGALGEMTQNIDAARKGCEIEYDPRTQVISIFKGEKATLILPSGAVADVSDEQGEADAGADAGPATGVPRAGARRGRPPKVTPPVQG